MIGKKKNRGKKRKGGGREKGREISMDLGRGKEQRTSNTATVARPRGWKKTSASSKKIGERSRVKGKRGRGQMVANRKEKRKRTRRAKKERKGEKLFPPA